MQKVILDSILSIGFEATFRNMTFPSGDSGLKTLVENYLNAMDELAAFVGYPEKLEKDSIL